MWAKGRIENEMNNTEKVMIVMTIIIDAVIPEIDLVAEVPRRIDTVSTL
jgi:hypothetical protein